MGNFPFIVLINNLIRSSSYRELCLRLIAIESLSLLETNLLEVIELAFVVVGKVPVDADVLKGHVVPVVVIRVVRDLVIVHVLALAPYSSQLNKFTRVKLLGSAALVLEFSRNPSSVNDDGCSLY